MIERIWYGWTEPGDADAYEALLADEIAPRFRAESDITGFRVGRRDRDDDVEFVTTITFPDWAAVESFAGEQYAEAHVPDAAREVLKDWEDTARHYEVREL
ncbi:antibiotic biosynthesis monooxygenase [Halocalculus aciditolerans]|uniref:Antibiotic biosynthesis monooxygenase n=1 Tax=Halocalculus aciditolerans TaxID=1383812 RepID=A0A830FGV0_9EURY|nr:antibiotic biosynthesis monooxygenase [Halocalculus aciditolerans]GGL54586.1 hypothetical protein GCM10009039_10870 [Halocalculus aciditolerans]